MAYYVSVRDDDRNRFALLAGPFNRHGDALRMRDRAVVAAGKVEPETAWMAFGTCHVKFGPQPAGRLNSVLDLPTDGSRITLPPLARTRVNRRVVMHGRNLQRPGLVVACVGICGEGRHFHPVERHVDALRERQ